MSNKEKFTPDDDGGYDFNKQASGTPANTKPGTGWVKMPPGKFASNMDGVDGGTPAPEPEV
ncbi:MAG: hypothetical protein KDI13_07770 [Alphaproteobacteria bacterium]|nr:hypothetical protein [Alphaproteobacteria bacterium]